jgi:hypothetical protein
VGIMSVLGTQLAVRFGTKQVVTVGLFFLAVFFAWVSTADTGTSYLEIVGQMLLGGSGVGLVSAPATRSARVIVRGAKRDVRGVAWTPKPAPADECARIALSGVSCRLPRRAGFPSWRNWRCRRV